MIPIYVNGDGAVSPGLSTLTMRCLHLFFDFCQEAFPFGNDLTITKFEACIRFVDYSFCGETYHRNSLYYQVLISNRAAQISSESQSSRDKSLLALTPSANQGYT